MQQTITTAYMHAEYSHIASYIYSYSNMHTCTQVQDVKKPPH